MTADDQSHADTIRRVLAENQQLREDKKGMSAICDKWEQEYAALKGENQQLREALNSVCNELGVPQPEYPQPVANAYWIAREALAGDAE